MKKKVLFLGLVLLTMAGANAVFAQITTDTKKGNPIDWWFNDIFVIRITGGSVFSYRSERLGAQATSPHEAFWRVWNAAGTYRLSNSDELQTLARTRIYLNCFDGRNNRIFILEPDTTIKVTSDKGRWRLRLEQGTIIEERSSANVSLLLEFAAAIDEFKVLKQVDDWKSKFPNKDSLAEHVISQKSQKSGFLGAVVGLGPWFTFPADMANIIAQWVIQAEIAYALAYVYGKTLTYDQFLTDLHILFGGEVAAKQVTGLSTISTITAGKYITSNTVETALKIKMAEKITSQLGTKLGSSVIKAIPVVSAVYSGWSDWSKTKEFGYWAKSYYKN
jgi:hypothetical protein